MARPTGGMQSSWFRNQLAVTFASFIGFMGFTLVMPFLPLYFRELGLTDTGEIALWTGFSMGVTPALTAVLAPAWGRLADRYGRKIMVERSLFSFVIVMGAMAFVSEPWHVFALRAVQGLFAGYGALTLTMAAESAPRHRMADAIGFVQTAQRLGPALGPVIGGGLAHMVGLRNTFIVASACYAFAVGLVFILYKEAPLPSGEARDARGRVSFRDVLSFENFIILMAVVFGLQFIDRSFGPVLPLYLDESGVPAWRVPLVAGLIFSTAAGAAAVGNYVAGRLQSRPARLVLASSAIVSMAASALFALAPPVWAMVAASAIFGLGTGVAMTTAYTEAGKMIPQGAHGTGFGLLTTASLTGLALSPVFGGVIGATSIRAVFVANAIGLALLAVLVLRQMSAQPAGPEPGLSREEG
ncbi:MAG: MFS transporter [Acidobacteriota bacterium]|nr:MFS transporter [Acidobacteriota bacterium]